MSSSTNQIYISDIINDADEEFIRTLFQECGKIVSIEMEKYYNNNLPRKHARITFETHEAAETAINELNYTKLDGLPIRIIWGDPETKRILDSGRGCILVGGLEKSIEAYQISEAFTKYGEVISCYIPTRYTYGHYLSCGFAYVQFRHPEDAQHAMQDLVGASVNGREIKIISCPKPFPM